ncbi:hypothetical protein GDO86_011349 [Hymenochirus boettgeri]|uniref:Uncharacterized protein n=1 Tax=Hymenochirus boettgeri TaxID=247094 RepID=A0A8T2JG36_9PIPI|nr:hypothetical protein GDO86_011349 [Hymenochirus boettgeri]
MHLLKDFLYTVMLQFILNSVWGSRPSNNFDHLQADLELRPTYMPFPCWQRWDEISGMFWTQHNFANFIEAVDCKHVCLVMPPCSGSKYPIIIKKTYCVIGCS